MGRFRRLGIGNDPKEKEDFWGVKSIFKIMNGSVRKLRRQPMKKARSFMLLPVRFEFFDQTVVFSNFFIAHFPLNTLFISTLTVAGVA